MDGWIGRIFGKAAVDDAHALWPEEDGLQVPQHASPLCRQADAAGPAPCLALPCPTDACKAMGVHQAPSDLLISELFEYLFEF